MMSAILLAFIGSASAFAVAAPTRVAIRTSSLSSPTMGFFDNLGKGNFFEDESPQDETKAFDARSRKQVKTLPSGVRSKLIKESSASDPNQPNRGVLYVVAGVAALVVAGGSGIFYNTEPGGTFSPIGVDQMREAAEFPITSDQKVPSKIPTYGTSSGR